MTEKKKIDNQQNRKPDSSGMNFYLIFDIHGAPAVKPAVPFCLPLAGRNPAAFPSPGGSLGCYGKAG